ncbi:MAG: hypothetical protein QOJ81_1846, partial [Chloroflexota bacterium]|nr:hypothetical protein [Chloroflexota bacterium]
SLATSSFDGIEIFDAATFDLTREWRTDDIDESSCGSLSFDRTGSIVACSFYSGQIALWDPATGDPIGTPLAAASNGSPVYFDPVTDQPVTQGEGGTLLWDLDADGRISSLGPDVGQTAAVSFSLDGSMIAIGRTNDEFFDDPESPDLVVLDATTLDEIARLRQPFGSDVGHVSLTNLAFSADGMSLTGASFGGASRWDLASSEPLGDPVRFDGYQGVDIAPDSKILVAADAAFVDATNDIVIWDLETRSQVATFGTGIDFDPTAAITLHATGVAVSPDGLTVAAGFTDGSTRLYDLTSGSAIATFAGLSEISALAFSPDGAVLAAADGAGIILLRDMATGAAIGNPLRSQTPLIGRLAFNPDGTLLLAGMGDNAILWRLADERPIAAIPGASTGAFSPDGNTLVTVGDRVEIWDMRLDSWRAAACQLAARNMTQEEWALYLPDEEYRETCP